MSADFAVIQINSKQYIVSEGTRLKVDRFSENDFSIIFAELSGTSYIGEPNVNDVGIELKKLLDTKDSKISVRRYKSKSRYRKNKGHRQSISILEVKKLAKGIKNKVIDGIVSESNIEIKKSEVKKPNSDNSKSKTNSVDQLDLTDRMIELLKKNGYIDISDLTKAKKEDLISIKGLGAKAVDRIFSQI